jgi:Fur family transcriptional regulator, ferric uptake regulator
MQQAGNGRPGRGPDRYAVTMAKVVGPGVMADFSTVDGVIAFLRSRGSRVTSSRRILLEVLFAADGHMSAEELADAVQTRAPDVHLSTIYRNLEELEHLGVISHSHLGHGPSSYLLASHAHAHFICADCGKMIEAPEEMFRGLARSARERLGFAIDPKHFAILGRCADCSRPPI